MLYTVTMNPALDKTATIEEFKAGEVNRITSLRQDPGGKGINVSKVAKKLGTASTAFAILAGSTGKKIASMVEDAGICLEAFKVEGETRTNLKVADPKLGTNTDINEPGPTIGKSDVQAFTESLEKRVEPGDVVVISGSIPRGVAPQIYAEMTRALKKAGAKVFVDADGEPLKYTLDAQPNLIKPNDVELSRLLNKKLDGEKDVAQAAQELVTQGIETVVVSMGGDGAVFAQDGVTLFARAPKVKVGSTVGAGDSVVAAMAHAMLAGLDLEDTARLAVATGSANVMCSGTQPAELSVIEELKPQVSIQVI